MSERQFKQRQARERFIHHMGLLETHLRLGEKRVHLDTATELLEALVELMGPPSLETAAFQIQICEVRKRIALRGQEERARLRLVRNMESN